MTNEQLGIVPPRQAYEWVKTGVWNLELFQRWVALVKSKAKGTV